MSNAALSWAFATPLSRSTDKLLLVCLANHADDEGACYPSQTKVMVDTGLDRKTIISGLRRLADLGLMLDTGLRKGTTQQVIVYRLTGVSSVEPVHYTYRTTDPATGEFYVGKRSCDGDPQADPYRGSGRWVQRCLAERRTLVKEILCRFGTAKEALDHEKTLFREVDGDPLCRNEGLPSLHRARSRRETVPNFLNGKNGTVPNIPVNSPVIPTERSQISHETVPFSGHGTINNPQLTPKEPPQEKQVRSNSRGSRLSEDWTPGPNGAAFARKQGLDPKPIFTVFRNYWLAKAGKDAVKVDWPRTWENWCLKEAEKTGAKPPSLAPDLLDQTAKPGFTSTVSNGF